MTITSGYRYSEIMEEDESLNHEIVFAIHRDEYQV